MLLKDRHYSPPCFPQTHLPAHKLNSLDVKNNTQVRLPRDVSEVIEPVQELDTPVGRGPVNIGRKVHVLILGFNLTG